MMIIAFAFYVVAVLCFVGFGCYPFLTNGDDLAYVKWIVSGVLLAVVFIAIGLLFHTAAHNEQEESVRTEIVMQQTSKTCWQLPEDPTITECRIVYRDPRLPPLK